MALQALSEYGLMAYHQGSQDVQVRVHFSCEEEPHWLYVMEHNRLLLQSLPVPQVPVEIKINATGPGCVMTQVAWTLKLAVNWIHSNAHAKVRLSSSAQLISSA